MGTLIQKGGVRLKLIGFMIFAILVTVLVLSYSIINVMKGSITQKSLEVAKTTIQRIGDASTTALLEKTQENRLNLNSMITKVKSSNIDGVLDVSIFARIRGDKDELRLKYHTGFGNYKDDQILKNKKLTNQINSVIYRDVKYLDSSITRGGQEVPTYLFVEPIFYKFQGKDLLLGVATLHYDKEAINGVVEEVIEIAIMITTALLVVMIILLYLFGSNFAKPIIKLTKAVKEVSNGNLDTELYVSSNDEIEVLALEFNQMVKGLKERLKMQKFVSSETASMINTDLRENLELGGEYKRMTFLFSDIRGFTAMSETKKPDEVVSIVNFYLDLQAKVIKANDGDIDKFVGDEVMATFTGLNSIKNAIQASMEIQKQIGQKNKEREKEQMEVCTVGIGINDGDVVVGNIGSSDRMDYTSIGSTVNLAARLCSSAKPGEILINEESFKDLTEKFSSTKLEPIKVKGVSNAVEIYSIEYKEEV